MNTFTLNEEQEKKLSEWLKTRELGKYAGAIGGRFTYSFTPTSIGLIVEVADGMGDKAKIDLSDYDSW